MASESIHFKALENIHFGEWDDSIHGTFNQMKRISSSAKIKPEKVLMSPDGESAQIAGSGGTLYSVSLSSCDCPDFRFHLKQKAPCKHIYRLASELGYLSDLPQMNRKAMSAFKKSIPAEIERFEQLYSDGAISLEMLNKIVDAFQSK